MRAKPIELMHVVALAAASCQTAYDFDQPPVEILNAVTTAERTYESAGGGAPRETSFPLEIEGVSLAGPLQADAGPEWEFIVAPYLWLANLGGAVGVAGNQIPIDVEFSDLVDNLDFGGSLLFEGRKGEWGFSVDGTYIALSGEGNPLPTPDADVDIDVGLLEVDATYRALESEGGMVEIIFGLRYLDLTTRVAFQGPPGTKRGSVDFVDPVIGVRGQWALGERWNLALRIDIGGFGVGSEFSSQLGALFGYKLSKAWNLALGYRGLAVNVDKDNVNVDAQIWGPVFGVGYSF